MERKSNYDIDIASLLNISIYTFYNIMEDLSDEQVGLFFFKMGCYMGATTNKELTEEDIACYDYCKNIINKYLREDKLNRILQK